MFHSKKRKKLNIKKSLYYVKLTSKISWIILNFMNLKPDLKILLLGLF